jgi:hypothetical protein
VRHYGEQLDQDIGELLVKKAGRAWLVAGPTAVDGATRIHPCPGCGSFGLLNRRH